MDDKDLNRRLREEIRPDDPMYDYFMSKKQEEEKEEEGVPDEGGKPEVTDYMKSSTKPKYRGPAPPNRFGIVPGYRWDGIIRGINYEAKRFTRTNITQMRKQQAYQWSVAGL